MVNGSRSSPAFRGAIGRVAIVSLVVTAAGACGDLAVPVLWLNPATSTPEGGQSLASTRYEAESTPPNVLEQSAIVDNTCFATNLSCPPDGVREGANCCSEGGVVTELLGRVPCAGPPGDPDAGDYVDCQALGGGVEFHDVSVPADGDYDVTWWYHCGANISGNANTFGDLKCGGLDYETGPGTGCRPQLIDVNGVPMTSLVDGQAVAIYQFPCYDDAWSVLHGATTVLPLQAGLNIITLHAPHEITLDSADIDAIDVGPVGQGVPPRVSPVASGY